MSDSQGQKKKLKKKKDSWVCQRRSAPRGPTERRGTGGRGHFTLQDDGMALAFFRFVLEELGVTAAPVHQGAIATHLHSDVTVSHTHSFFGSESRVCLWTHSSVTSVSTLRTSRVSFTGMLKLLTAF